MPMTMMTAGSSQSEFAVTVERCRQPERIERILAEDYFDEPIRYFSRSLIHAVASDWFARSDDIFFLTASVNGHYAGFVFAHRLGPAMWRDYVRSHWHKHPLSLSWVIWRQFGWERLRGHLRRLVRPRPVSTNKTRELPEVPRLDRPFGWTTDRPDVAQLDLLFVSPPYRGHGVAAALLDGTIGVLRTAGVSLVESHVDPWNAASLRAFLKAGWQAFQMSANDFYLRYEIAAGTASAGIG